MGKDFFNGSAHSGVVDRMLCAAATLVAGPNTVFGMP
jgi:hypothetical protein